MNAKPILSRSRCLAVAFAVFAGLFWGLPVQGGTAGTTYYTCAVSISGGTHNCTDNVITVTYSSGVQRVLRVNLAPSYLRLDAFLNVCNPSGWWSHFADSPTNDGYGGDLSSAQHDAEAYVLGADFQMYTMDNPRGNAWPSYRTAGVAPTGCYRVQWTIYESRTLFDDDGDPADSARVDVTTSRGFESAPYNETDSEDTTGADANLWYVGLNRTVGSSYRSGTGVSQACFVLSTTTSPSAATLSALCP